ncbi:MAG: phosphoribosyltransferase [Bacteroidetes bacterium]|nr:phosphoribosyltransferase [Bacteroidota bacterium]
MEVLNHDQITKKIHRLAFQVYEGFLEEKELVIAGINGNGFELARILCEEVRAISPINCRLIEIKIDKHHPTASSTTLVGEMDDLNHLPVLIIDDVLNTGRTMVYAISAFIREGCQPIRTLVLANRNHRSFPVAADYVGISMATTLQEHLNFKIDQHKYSLELE